jgi:molybdate transport system substrate-binding protein
MLQTRFPARALATLLVAALLLLIVPAGCARSEPAPAFTVGAAASLTDVVGAALARFEAEGGARGRASFASSSTVARQIESGAPFDLFLSANLDWVDHLEDRGLLDRVSRREIARNRLVAVQPLDAPFPLTLVGELSADLRPRPWTTGDPAHVPAGRYARAALESLGWFADLEPTLVPAADVRAALRLVERGEVDWGLVYATDARASDAVVVAHEVDPALHPPVVYAGGVVAGGSEEAAAFLHWLAGEGARDLFAERGFAAPEEALR